MQAVKENQRTTLRRTEAPTSSSASSSSNAPRNPVPTSSTAASSNAPDNATLGDIIRQLAATVQRFDDRLQLIEGRSAQRITNEAARITVIQIPPKIAAAPVANLTPQEPQNINAPMGNPMPLN